MKEYLILSKDELEKLVNNVPVLADIGRPIVICSKEYFEQQKEDMRGNPNDRI